MNFVRYVHNILFFTLTTAGIEISLDAFCRQVTTPA